jgi:hypothetical protein
MGTTYLVDVRSQTAEENIYTWETGSDGNVGKISQWKASYKIWGFHGDVRVYEESRLLGSGAV